MEKNRKQIIDEVNEIVEEKKKMLEQWGFRFDSDNPLVWKWQGDEVLWVKVTKEDITVRYIHNYDYLAGTVIPLNSGSDWRNGLERALKIAVEVFVAHVISSNLKKCLRGCRFVVKFELTETKWNLNVYTTKNGGMTLSVDGDLLKSPLDALQAIVLVSL